MSSHRIFKMHIGHIDDDIIDIVSEMNRKGFHTTHSCQGHRPDKYTHRCNFWNVIFTPDVYRRISRSIWEWNILHPNHNLVIERIEPIRIEPTDDTGDIRFYLYPVVKSPRTQDIKISYEMTEFTDEEYAEYYKQAIETFRQFVRTLPTIL